MTRKETALDALNKKIPKLEEKINQDKLFLSIILDTFYSRRM